MGNRIPQENFDWVGKVVNDAPLEIANGIWQVASVIIPVPGAKIMAAAAGQGWTVAKKGAGKMIGFSKAMAFVPRTKSSHS